MFYIAIKLEFRREGNGLGRALSYNIKGKATNNWRTDFIFLDI